MMRFGRPGIGAAIFILTAAIFVASPVRVATDSRYSMLVSESLLRNRSFALDAWFPDRSHLPYQVEEVRGHVYAWYPPGGPVLATPFVWLLHRVGISAVAPNGTYDPGGDMKIQGLLASFFMALLTFIFFKTASAILPPSWSALVALGGAFGTQVWTTASRVLWGDTFLVLIIGVVLWLLVMDQTGKRRLSPPLLATLLSWGYFTRPTASLPILAVTLYVALRDRKLLLPYAATGAAWLGAFLVYSSVHFGALLPSYYRLSAFSVRTLGSGLLGVLVSPSRGLLIFVPVTLFVAYLVVRYWRSLPHARLVVPALIAVLGQVFLMGAFAQWHGGHGYGARCLTPIVPWLVLLATLGLRALLDGRGPRWQAELQVGALLLLCSVVVQSRGAFARETWNWNVTPSNVGLHPERFWSWRFPQPLAGIAPWPAPLVFPRLALGQRLDVGSPGADPYLVSGWSDGEGAMRWTDGHVAEVAFALDDTGALPDAPLQLEIELEPFLGHGVREQRVDVQLNRDDLESLYLRQPGVVRVAVRLPAKDLARENRLRLWVPNAAFVARFGLGADSRQVAVAVHSMRLVPGR